MCDFSYFRKARQGREKKSGPFYARRAGRRGQTLTEYGLIIALITVTALQAMDYVGFLSVKEYATINCTLLIARMEGHSSEVIMSAVDDYLSQSSTWGNEKESWVIPAAVEIHAKMHDLIYNGQSQSVSPR